MASLNNRAVSDNDPWEIFHNGFLEMIVSHNKVKP